MAAPYRPDDHHAWVIEPVVDDETGQLDLHMFPVHASGSLASVPAVNVALIGYEHGDDE